MAVVEAEGVELDVVLDGQGLALREDSPGVTSLNIALSRLAVEPTVLETREMIVVPQYGAASVLDADADICTYANGFMNWLRLGGQTPALRDSYLCVTTFQHDDLLVPIRALRTFSTQLRALTPSTLDGRRARRLPPPAIVVEWDRLRTVSASCAAVFAEAVIRQQLRPAR